MSGHASEHDLTGSVITSVATAFVALMPDGLLGHAEKLLWVFMLAVVGEAGRRLVDRLMGKGKR